MVECSICLIPEIIHTEKCTLQCSHNYCKPCLDGWLNTGKTTCPICVQEISYFDYDQDKYRIIKIRQDSVPTIHINENNIMINKKMCTMVRLLSCIIIGVLFFQTYIIHRMYDKNDTLRAQCSIELDKYNSIIDDEHNVIMKIADHEEHRICSIPFYYIKRCFNL